MKYLVALSAGGFAEYGGKYYYQDFQVIDAENYKEAKDIYNQKNNCEMFRGETLGLFENFNPILVGHPPIEQSTLCFYRKEDKQ